jgi:hypothetical protein
MNPFSLILIGLGLIMIYVGWKGSQHTVIADLLGHGPKTAAPKTTPPAGSKSGTVTGGQPKAQPV